LSNWKHTIITAAIIVAVACVFALATNAARSDGIPLIRPEIVASDANGPIISLARAKELYDRGVPFIDSRSPQEYRAGHIRNARLLFYSHVEEDWELVMAGIALADEVAVYCSGEGCNSSYLVADHLMNVGYEKVFVFHGGWPEWSAAGYPVNGQRQELQLYKME